MYKKLIVACGNQEGGDDCDSWDILKKIARRFDSPVPKTDGEWVDLVDGSIRFGYLFQCPEDYANELDEYDHVVLISTHNSEQLDDLIFQPIEATTLHSGFCPHLGSEELLAVVKTLNEKNKQAKILSVRGYCFEPVWELSTKTAQLVDQAVELLLADLGFPQVQQHTHSNQAPYLEMPLKTYLEGTGELLTQSKPVIREHALELIVNGESWMTFICSPINLEELAIGFLWNQNVISEKSQLKSIHLSPDLSSIEVEIDAEVTKPTRFHRTSTGFEPHFTTVARTSAGSFQYPAKDLIVLYKQFTMKQKLHDYAGGFHSAGLSDGKGVNLVMEDLGRHNCVDKLAGAWLLEEHSFEPDILLLTGRVSSEMIMKSRALACKIIVSRTSPTVLAIEMAEQAGICLVGYMRSNHFEVYSHFEYLA